MSGGYYRRVRRSGPRRLQRRGTKQAAQSAGAVRKIATAVGNAYRALGGVSSAVSVLQRENRSAGREVDWAVSAVMEKLGELEDALSNFPGAQAHM